MLKKTLHRGFNLLKITTWLTAIFSLVLLVIIAFFVMFPQTIKTSLEERLSQVSGLQATIEKTYGKAAPFQDAGNGVQ